MANYEQAQPEEGEVAAPNALGPEALREEFVNMLQGRGGLRREKAERLTDDMLVRLMNFYAAQAEPEVTDDTQKIMVALTGLEEAAFATIRAGATVVDFMTDDVKGNWVRNAANLRVKVQEVLGLLA